ncbi:general stress protein [Arthrobacter sp. Br18]|uniref:general stress protein n=1 Tax=Arthrobacter sp. Br18 TaxID=1312954 RepID=UPI00068595FE|nr:general stress protein [Arthrobacter sp. Br18]
MSTQLGRTPSRDESRTLPKGETVGRYTAYLEAQKAVDYLADNKFPVEKVSILGNDLKTVERVTGRLSYPRVAMASAATGAWFGFFVGLILTLFGGSEAVSTVVSSMALGAVFWLLFGVITYAFQRGKRDFTSTSQVIATSYDVIVDPEVSSDARRQLQQLPMNGQPQHAGAPSTGWGQPNSGSTGGPQSQQPPARPQSWNDPYVGQGDQGSMGGQGDSPTGGQDSPTGTPAQVSSAGDGVTSGVPQPAAYDGPRRGQFPDLPDGRPQYGERLDIAPDEAAEPGEEGTGHGSTQVADPGTSSSPR